jgi:hypothetical protein
MCSPYKFKYKNLIIPNTEIFGHLCTSSDRTGIFMTTFARISILTLILNFNIIDKYEKKFKIAKYIKTTILILLLINIIFMYFVLIKVPKY